MFISGARLKNYKPFFDSGDLSFDQGINVVIGTNNAGKTALLETLELRAAHKPHLSTRTKPTRRSQVNEESEIVLSVTIDGPELREIVRLNSTIHVLPFDDHDRTLIAFNNCLQDGMTLQTRIGPAGPIPREIIYGFYKQIESDELARLVMNEKGEFEYHGRSRNREKDFGLNLIRDFARSIYRFRAERPNIGRSSIGNSDILNPDASNLPEVLNALQTNNPVRFSRLNRLLTEIFPHISGISVGMVENQGMEAKVFEIKIWRVGLETERQDLALPLTESGTGVGQALAILYILINSEEPRTIIIDEPQSFLHPGAAKKLMQLMNAHPQHQYFVSTHSPEVLSAANPSTITLLECEGPESKASTLNLDQTHQVRKVLESIGIDFRDVFFAANIIWVEGPTEEKAIPLILKKYLAPALESEITILRLSDTGSLQAKKNAKRVFEIYRTLSNAHALVPPVTAVILDNEGRSEQTVNEMHRLAGGLLHFLQRRCFENYLLDPEAIAAVANEQPNFASVPIDSHAVADLIATWQVRGRFLDEPDSSHGKDEEWIRRVDGARLLEQLFSDLSETRVTYQKTIHSPQITKWLLENDRGELKEIANLIERVTQSQG